MSEIVFNPWPDGWVVLDPGPCSGECLTGYDVGVPGPGIAYPHPDCPLHGWGDLDTTCECPCCMEPPPIQWPSEEALRAYAWLDKPRREAEFQRMFEEAFWEVWGPVLEEAAVKWEAERWMRQRNDYHIFYEDWLGLDSIPPGIKVKIENCEEK